MASIKPINLEGDTFAQMKQDMTASISRLLRLMQRYGAEKAAVTLKLTVSLEEQELGSGEKGTVPTFEHKVTTTVQRKDEVAGKLPGEWTLEPDGSGGFNLKPLPDQMDLFEEMAE